jgi:hypothetical protein
MIRSVGGEVMHVDKLKIAGLAVSDARNNKKKADAKGPEKMMRADVKGKGKKADRKGKGKMMN